MSSINALRCDPNLPDVIPWRNPGRYCHMCVCVSTAFCLMLLFKHLILLPSSPHFTACSPPAVRAGIDLCFHGANRQRRDRTVCFTTCSKNTANASGSHMKRSSISWSRAERCRNLRSWHTEALAYFCEGSGLWIYRLFLSMLRMVCQIWPTLKRFCEFMPITLSNAQWLKRGPGLLFTQTRGPNGKNTPRLRTRSYACTLRGLNTTFDKRPKEALGFS